MFRRLAQRWQGRQSHAMQSNLTMKYPQEPTYIGHVFGPVNRCIIEILMQHGILVVKPSSQPPVVHAVQSKNTSAFNGCHSVFDTMLSTSDSVPSLSSGALINFLIDHDVKPSIMHAQLHFHSTTWAWCSNSPARRYQCAIHRY